MAEAENAAGPRDDEVALLRENLFAADLLQLPVPESGLEGFLPPDFTGTLPVLVYPPLHVRSMPEGASMELQVTPHHIYYGALRELAETADPERADLLRMAVKDWNPRAAVEVTALANAGLRRALETARHHYELAEELGGETDAGTMEWLDQCLSGLPDEEEPSPELQPAFNQAPTPEQATFMEAQALTFGPEPDAARAIEMLRPLSQNHPDAGEVWFVLGAAHRRRDDPAEAERCLRRAARLSPQEPFVWWELCRALMAMSEWRAAEEAIGRALELDGENAIYLCDLARVLVRRSDRPGAEEALERAAALAPYDEEVLRTQTELGSDGS